jgi:hypothetical protein
VAKEAAEQSFPSLARVVVLFHRFKFQGSNTYLLPHHASGDALRRLYNQFTASLQNLPEDSLLRIRKGVEEYLKYAEGSTSPQSGAGPAKNSDSTKPAPPPRDLSDSFLEDRQWLKELNLKQPLEDWQHWLEQALPQVSEAADSAAAYADLIAQELALLNKTFFSDQRGFFRSNWRIERDGDRWPSLLSDGSLEAIVRAQAQSRWFLPLTRVGGSEAPRGSQARPEVSQESESTKKDLQGQGRQI